MRTVARFREYPSAHLARGLLESEGIEAFVLDENLARIAWHYSDAMGGVRLQVANADAERAAELLGIDASADALEAAGDDGAEELERCPRCASGRIGLPTRRVPTGLTALLTAAAILGDALILLLLPLARRDRRCDDCHASWRR